jgi:hypothetical protein
MESVGTLLKHAASARWAGVGGMFRRSIDLSGRARSRWSPWLPKLPVYPRRPLPFPVCQMALPVLVYVLGLRRLVVGRQGL